LKKLKERWEIDSNWQLIIILLVFSITGSAAAKLAGPTMDFLGFSRDIGGFLYWTIRIILIFPLYQILLVFFGWLFGQHKFFWKFEKKMIRRLKLGFLLKKE
jgi:hypothetical protein